MMKTRNYDKKITLFLGELDRAPFDRLRMTTLFVDIKKTVCHPEPVEGRPVRVFAYHQRILNASSL
jgi:hypothetical protein